MTGLVPASGFSFFHRRCLSALPLASYFNFSSSLSVLTFSGRPFSRLTSPLHLDLAKLCPSLSTMILPSISTAVLAAAFAVPGQCLSPAPSVSTLSTTVLNSASTPGHQAHVHSARKCDIVPFSIRPLSLPILADMPGNPTAAFNHLATFTSWYPQPTQTLSCDSSTLGKVLHTTNGKAFLVNCDYDFPGNDFAQLSVTDWAHCMEACSVAPNCKAFSYDSWLSKANCFLKTAGNPETWDIGKGVRIGWLYVETARATTTATTPTETSLQTVEITPLPTGTIAFSPDFHSYVVRCYQCGSYAIPDDAIAAIDFFCANGPPGNQTFGGYFPDRLLQGGDSISLEFFTEDWLSIMVIVTVNEGCVIDFASMDDGTCASLLTAIFVDDCDDANPEHKYGGYMEDDCVRWTLDIQYPTDKYNWEDCVWIPAEGQYQCYTWRKGIYDGINGDDSLWCPSN